jgi:hypothetical protein
MDRRAVDLLLALLKTPQTGKRLDVEMLGRTAGRWIRRSLIIKTIMFPE